MDVGVERLRAIMVVRPAGQLHAPVRMPPHSPQIPFSARYTAITKHTPAMTDGKEADRRISWPERRRRGPVHPNRVKAARPVAGSVRSEAGD